MQSARVIELKKLPSKSAEDLYFSNRFYPDGSALQGGGSFSYSLVGARTSYILPWKRSPALPNNKTIACKEEQT